MIITPEGSFYALSRRCYAILTGARRGNMINSYLTCYLVTFQPSNIFKRNCSEKPAILTGKHVNFISGVYSEFCKFSRKFFYRTPPGDCFCKNRLIHLQIVLKKQSELTSNILNILTY